MTVLDILIGFASVAILIYAALFVAGVRRKRLSWTVVFGGFILSVATGAAIALGIAVAVVFGVTAYYGSPQGPLGLIVLGPLALFIGGLAGASRWLVKRPAA